MKKILILFALLGLFNSSYAQETPEEKKRTLLAGIVLGGDISFNNPATQSIIPKVGAGGTVGIAIDWSMVPNVGLSTGLEFDFTTFKSTFKDEVYFNYKDKDILMIKEYNPGENTPYFLLNERTQNNIYLSVPVMLKFQTNYLGYMRYFGKFGLRNSFNLKTSTNDEGQGYELKKVDGVSAIFENGDSSLKGMRTKGYSSFYRGSIGLAGGAEYKIAGSTTIMAELGYYYGFTEMFQQKDETRSLFNVRDEKRDYYAPRMKQGQLMLKISLLF